MELFHCWMTESSDSLLSWNQSFIQAKLTKAKRITLPHSLNACFPLRTWMTSFPVPYSLSAFSFIDLRAWKDSWIKINKVFYESSENRTPSRPRTPFQALTDPNQIQMPHQIVLLSSVRSGSQFYATKASCHWRLVPKAIRKRTRICKIRLWSAYEPWFTLYVSYSFKLSRVTLT